MTVHLYCCCNAVQSSVPGEGKFAGSSFRGEPLLEVFHTVHVGVICRSEVWRKSIRLALRMNITQVIIVSIRISCFIPWQVGMIFVQRSWCIFNFICKSRNTAASKTHAPGENDIQLCTFHNTAKNKLHSWYAAVFQKKRRKK